MSLRIRTPQKRSTFSSMRKQGRQQKCRACSMDLSFASSISLIKTNPQRLKLDREAATFPPDTIDQIFPDQQQEKDTNVPSEQTSPGSTSSYTKFPSKLPTRHKMRHTIHKPLKSGEQNFSHANTTNRATNCANSPPLTKTQKRRNLASPIRATHSCSGHRAEAATPLNSTRDESCQNDRKTPRRNTALTHIPWPRGNLT